MDPATLILPLVGADRIRSGTLGPGRSRYGPRRQPPQPDVKQGQSRHLRYVVEGLFVDLPSANEEADRDTPHNAGHMGAYMKYTEDLQKSGKMLGGDALQPVSDATTVRAIRLGRVLCELMPDTPEALGLLALMLLHDSRRDTRVDARGEIVLLEDQDCGRWDRAQIEEGVALVERSLRMRQPGPYQVQAAIAACHAEAKAAEQTDWAQIAALYSMLSCMVPSPVVELNHAVAAAMSEGLERGLHLIDRLGDSGRLDGYHLYHSARADLLRRMGLYVEAAEAYHHALTLAGNNMESAYLRRRLAEVTSR